MKKLLYALMLAGTLMGATSCLDDDVEDTYKDWRNTNAEWLAEQIELLDANGDLFYTPVTASWDPNATVYIHWFNDQEATKDNLSPIYTSTVDVKYIGRIYDGTAFDSSFVNTSPRDSIYRCTISNMIEGWGIALPQMHVGDSVRVLIDYPQAYGTYSVGDYIKPYSVLQFDIKLDDIYAYEVKY